MLDGMSATNKFQMHIIANKVKYGQKFNGKLYTKVIVKFAWFRVIIFSCNSSSICRNVGLPVCRSATSNFLKRNSMFFVIVQDYIVV